MTGGAGEWDTTPDQFDESSLMQARMAVRSRHPPF